MQHYTILLLFSSHHDLYIHPILKSKIHSFDQFSHNSIKQNTTATFFLGSLLLFRLRVIAGLSQITQFDLGQTLFCLRDYRIESGRRYSHLSHNADSISSFSEKQVLHMISIFQQSAGVVQSSYGRRFNDRDLCDFTNKIRKQSFFIPECVEFVYQEVD